MIIMGIENTFFPAQFYMLYSWGSIQLSTGDDLDVI
jgi:hypothetical protein